MLCDLPDPVVEDLECIARTGRAHFSWTGTTQPQTVTYDWRSRLKEIADMALVPGFKPHRLGDTFAVEPLQRGVAMQDVSTLLGHSSIQSAKRYYASWNRSRRDRLAAIVRDANEGDELLRELARRSPNTSARAVPSSPRKRPGQANQNETATERAWTA